MPKCTASCASVLPTMSRRSGDLVPTVTPLPGLDQVDFARQSLYTELEHRHLGITSVNRKLEVVAADPDTAASLQVAPGSPTFYFHTLGQVSDGRVLEYSIAQYRGDNNYFTFNIART